MDSSSGSQFQQQPQLPPGFRFHPTDEELVIHYLKKKADSAPLPVSIIADIDLYKFDPWELPSKATFGEQEWYFFSPRDRKYPNGARPNRAATSGYWKATGTDKPILASNGHGKVGVKKALVFYGGKPPKGVKTPWIMHEYRLPHNNNNISLNSTSKSPPLVPDPAHTTNKNSLRLDDWVLCRIYKKSNSNSLPRLPFPMMSSTLSMANTMYQSSKPASSTSACYEPLGLENDDNFFNGILEADQSMQNGSDNPMKRELPSEFWNVDTAGSSSSISRRLHCDPNVVKNNSFVSLLSQLPQSTTLHSNPLQQFHLPNINWNA